MSLHNKDIRSFGNVPIGVSAIESAMPDYNFIQNKICSMEHNGQLIRLINTHGRRLSDRTLGLSRYEQPDELGHEIRLLHRRVSHDARSAQELFRANQFAERSLPSRKDKLESSARQFLG